VLLGNECVYDQELIYARVISLLVSLRDIKFDDLLAYELAAYPLSMFNSEGETNIAKSKPTLKHILQVTVSERNCPIPDNVICDASAFLWAWPTDKLSVYVNNFKVFVSQALQTANVTLVFDRYFPSSIEAFTGMHRGGSTCGHNLTLEMLAPAKQVIIIIKFVYCHRVVKLQPNNRPIQLTITKLFNGTIY